MLTCSMFLTFDLCDPETERYNWKVASILDKCLPEPYDLWSVLVESWDVDIPHSQNYSCSQAEYYFYISHVHFHPQTSCTPFLAQKDGVRLCTCSTGQALPYGFPKCSALSETGEYRFTLRTLVFVYCAFNMNSCHSSPPTLREKDEESTHGQTFEKPAVFLWCLCWLTTCRRIVFPVGILVESPPVQQPV